VVASVSAVKVEWGEFPGQMIGCTPDLDVVSIGDCDVASQNELANLSSIEWRTVRLVRT